MKAIAVTPRKRNGVRIIDVPIPKVDEIPDGEGVLVKVLRVGLDGTDKEIVDGDYGDAPVGEEYLILGHESLGIVVEVGENITEFSPGDFVTATVRRPGTSLYDQIGLYDLSTDRVFFERGINLLHGYLTEYYVEISDYLIKVPEGLKEVGVLLEPTSIVEKGISQAFEIQKRLKVWNPQKVAVLGAGPLGLLATLLLRLRGLEVTVFARTEPPYLNSSLVEELAGRYLSTKQISLEKASDTYGPFDIIFEATGYSPLVFQSMKLLAKNGILILSSVTSGDRHVEVEADKINMGFVLGNKLCFGTVNANKSHFELGVKDLSQALLQYPGWINKLLSHPIEGLDCNRIKELLQSKKKGIIKIFCKIAPIP
ncbi:MAG: glucose 1-dehydrogenase [Candidatus Ranarchaeia archaeon]|jgi:threonine dehydrogenase-like Zn-dependent dehydrogenase